MNNSQNEISQALEIEITEDLFIQTNEVPPTLDDRLTDLMNWADFAIGGPRPRKGEPTANVDLALKVLEAESVQPAAADAHKLYVDGLREGTGGREGMIAALNIALMLLNRDSGKSLGLLLEPLAGLASALRELGHGAIHPALERRSPRVGRPASSPRSRKRQFIIRCVWAAEACEEIGDKRPCETVCEAAKQTAEQFFSGSTYVFSKEMIERWRRTYAREARERRDTDINFSLALPLSFAPFVTKVLLAGLEPHNFDRAFDAIAYDLGLRVEPANRAAPPTNF